ncbi:hypothetical protein [Cellulomonas uda]|uniref:Uncharacterized protein n=1 Tax=Cellulomonas uda TaxID=1714 RepID=A0A4Y3KFS6_CELUD|nr:hypothetical protein [Cellulomonas uda]NII66946.1 hypothetical protein [Cellulomonas uda]GEA82743.1 hypothetical protein CUD01_31870 [Cellulomonas uda]
MPHTTTRRTLTAAIITGGLVTAGLLNVNAASGAITPPDASFVYSGEPVADTISRADLIARAKAGQGNLTIQDDGARPQTFGPSDLTTDAATTASSGFTATPSGFVLWNPGSRVDDYHYRSSPVQIISGRCYVSGCTATEKINYVLKESLVGGSSKRWALELLRTQIANDPHITYTNSASYVCGRNISGAPDKICEGNSDPSDPSMAVASPEYYTFESTSGYINFPMVRVNVLFSNDLSAYHKFRGWDVKVSSATKLSATSDGAK